MRVLFAVVAAVSLVVAIAAVAYAVGRTTAPEVIRAQRFELVDEEGDVLWIFGTARGERGLLLFDGQGELRARLSTDRAGDPGLQLRDSNGQLRAQVGAARMVWAPPGGGGGHGVSYPESSVLLLGEQGRLAFKVVASPGGRNSAELLDQNGKNIWCAGSLGATAKSPADSHAAGTGRTVNR